jgi:hypothetical protein
VGADRRLLTFELPPIATLRYWKALSVGVIFVDRRFL